MGTLLFGLALVALVVAVAVLPSRGVRWSMGAAVLVVALLTLCNMHPTALHPGAVRTHVALDAGLLNAMSP